MAASADLIVNIVTKMSGDGMAQAEKQTSKFRQGLGKASVVATAALAGIGAAAIGAANAAAEDAQSQALLANAMTRGAGATAKQIQATEDWIDAQSRATGVTDDELRPALATLVKATGSVAKSQSALQTAMDVSASTGKPLKAVTEAMAKGFSGQTTALGRLVPGLDQATLKSGDMARVMAELNNKTGGAAAAAADTAAGKMKRFKNSLGETQESIGAALLPALDKLSGVLMTVGQWAQDHGTMFAIIAGSVAVLAAAIIALNLAVTIYTAVTTLAASATLMAWGAALLPILLVVAAVAAVVAIVVILWHKSETFRSIVLAVWGAIQTVAKTTGKVLGQVWQKVSSAGKKAFDFIKRNWQIMLAALLGPFVLAIVLIVKNWDRIKTAATKVWTAIKNGASNVKDMLIRVWQSIQQALSNVATHIANAFRNAWNTVKSIASNIAGAIRSAFDGVKHAAATAVSTAVSTLAGLPGKVKAAFSGAGTLLLGIGADIINGLVRGINGAAHLVESAVSSIINKIPKKARQLMGISSPSKVMKTIGKDIMAGLTVGMADGVAGVKRVSQIAVDAITETIKKAAKTAKQARTLTTAAVKSISDETAALVSNAKKRAAVYKAIATQTQTVKALRDAWASLKTSVADSATAYGSFASAAGTTIDDMLGDMASKVANVQLFQKTLQQLGKLHLNRATIAELAQAGPEDALARAQALLAGGGAAVAQVNQLQGQLTKAANTLGSQTADAMYKTGIDAQQALLDGLVADKSKLEKTANKLARDLAAAVRKALKKYTPSGQPAGSRAAPSMASYAAPALATTPAGRSAAPAGVTNIYVSGAVDPESTARQVRRLLEGHDRRIGVQTA